MRPLHQMFVETCLLLLLLSQGSGYLTAAFPIWLLLILIEYWDCRLSGRLK